MNQAQSQAAVVQATLARIKALSRRDVRQSQRCFWIEGIRQFVQACEVNYPLDNVVHSPVLLKSSLAERHIRDMRAAGVPYLRVSPEQFRGIFTAEHASGIGAIARERWTPLGHADPTRGLCWLVLEDIRSPGNLGTILRTAEAVGVGGVIFVNARCDPFDPTVVRATMGGLFPLKLVRTTQDRLQDWLRAHGVEIMGLSPQADRLWTDLPPTGPIALAIGEERRGLSDPLRRLCDATVRLPMSGRTDSLNVGVAAGVMLYELVRRNRPTKEVSQVGQGLPWHPASQRQGNPGPTC